MSDRQQKLNEGIAVIIASLPHNTSVNSEHFGDYKQVTLLSSCGNEIVISTEGEELTVMFGQTHWHINDYTDSPDITPLLVEVEHDINQILAGRLRTFSAYKNDRCLGGSCFDPNEHNLKESVTSVWADVDYVILESWGTQPKRIEFQHIES